jgi:hypothetical protein
MLAFLNRLGIKGILALVLASIGIFFVFSILMAAARTFPVPGYDIVDLEFAWNGTQANLIMQTWGAIVVAQELYVTYLDFGYLVGYGAMAFSLLALGTYIVQSNDKLVQAGGFFMVFSLISPVSDVIENMNLIPMMAGFPAVPMDVLALVASFFATVKFGVLFLSIGVFSVEVIFALASRKRR